MPDQQQDPGMPVRVVAGGNHTLIIFSAGQVYLAGSDEGHLIDQAVENNSIFSHVRVGADVLGPIPISLCSATWEASNMVHREQQIQTFGLGERGELGRGQGVTTVSRSDGRGSFEIKSRPSDMTLEEQRAWPCHTAIKDLASGVNHTVAILANGEVYGWGNGRKGQLGEPSGIIWEPRKIEGLSFRVIRAVCGREFTFLVGDPQTGTYAILGVDKWQLKSQSPTSLVGWKDIGASWGSVFVLDQSGKITSWGRDDHGQLAPEGLPPIEKMAVGSEHVVTLTRDGEVLAWGWGEHGNCGPDIDEDGDVKHRWSKIDISSINRPVVGIGAGYATSWLWTASV